MNKYFLQLKKEFRKYGSWALWDENGGIEEIRKDENFELLIKLHIIFMGFNASYNLQKTPDWANYHFIKDKKRIWNQEPCQKFAYLSP